MQGGNKKGWLPIKARKYGSSLFLRIPSDTVKMYNIKENDEFKFSFDEEKRRLILRYLMDLKS